MAARAPSGTTGAGRTPRRSRHAVAEVRRPRRHMTQAVYCTSVTTRLTTSFCRGSGGRREATAVGDRSRRTMSQAVGAMQRIAQDRCILRAGCLPIAADAPKRPARKAAAAAVAVAGGRGGSSRGSAVWFEDDRQRSSGRRVPTQDFVAQRPHQQQQNGGALAPVSPPRNYPVT